MMLLTGNQNVRFAPRLVEGVQTTTAVQPDRLILDGQQSGAKRIVVLSN